MYIFELVDIMFFIKSLNNRTSNFNTVDYVTFSSSTASSSSESKLIHNFSSNNKIRSFYFNRFIRLWNSLPVINLDLSINTIKSQLKQCSWEHFINNFNPANPCSLHYLCPCSKCYTSSSPINFNSLNSY